MYLRLNYFYWNSLNFADFSGLIYTAVCLPQNEQHQEGALQGKPSFQFLSGVGHGTQGSISTLELCPLSYLALPPSNVHLCCGDGGSDVPPRFPLEEILVSLGLPTQKTDWSTASWGSHKTQRGLPDASSIPFPTLQAAPGRTTRQVHTHLRAQLHSWRHVTLASHCVTSSIALWDLVINDRRCFEVFL